MAHPHVWIDGGVDFAMRDGDILEALQVTWLYDEFETLYMIAEAGLRLDSSGGLDNSDRQALIRHLSNWPEDFDGSAHLSVDGLPVPLDWPQGLDAQVIDGRLQMTFTRPLSTPVSLAGRSVDVGFYESTYFFAFSITNAPRILPAQSACAAKVIRFDPETAPDGLLADLAALDREETPKIANVGALFADRISLTCG
ncbi:DUF1007 family protein [Mameliella sp.]|uniref:DUF1007 family protein n=1 Tax=Mameliella sp. TaxID=1924940 RepID=UPI003B504C2C